jgi:hypothetical protein
MTMPIEPTPTQPTPPASCKRPLVVRSTLLDIKWDGKVFGVSWHFTLTLTRER